MLSKQALAQQHAPKINKQIDEFEATNRAGIAAFGSDLRELLAKVDLAEKKWIHHSEVIPHEDNREGELLLALRVWRLLKILFEKGFSYTECALALTCGVPPDATGQRWISKAQNLYEESGGMIAPYRSEMITAASGAGSHTTACLQLLAYAMHHNVECPSPEFESLCDKGFLAPSLIMAKQPSIKRAVEKGQLEYFHIRHEIVLLCPNLMRVLSESDNAKNTTFSKEGMIQTMNAIHRRALQVGAKDEAAWKQVALQCAQSVGLEFLTDVNNYAKFVERLSGGRDAKFLKEIESFSKASRVVRELDPRFLADLAASGTWVEVAPDFAIAMVKATISAAVNFVDHGVADVFKASDFSASRSKLLKDIKTGQAAIMKFKSLGEKLGVVNDATWVRAEGGFSGRVALLTFSKRSVGRKTYESIEEIGVDSFEELKQAYGSKLDRIACPWHVVPIAGASTKNAKTDPKVPSREMRSIASGGTLDASNLQALGYTPGTFVQKVDVENNTTQKYHIKRLEERAAVVVSVNSDAELLLDYDKLIEYSISRTMKATVSIQNNNP